MNEPIMNNNEIDYYNTEIHNSLFDKDLDEVGFEPIEVDDSSEEDETKYGIV